MATLPRDRIALQQVLSTALGIAPGEGDDRAIESYHVVLGCSWERMEALLGPLGARAIVNHGIRLAARRYPPIGRVGVGEVGVDLSGFEIAADSPDPRELRCGLEELCLAILQTLIELTGSVLAAPLIEEIQQRRGGQHGRSL